MTAAQPPLPPTFPAPSPTPQVPPTLFGLLLSIGTGWGTHKLTAYAGFEPTYAAMVTASVASATASLLHKLAQKWHLEDVLT